MMNFAGRNPFDDPHGLPEWCELQYEFQLFFWIFH